MGYTINVDLYRVDASQPNFTPRWQPLTDEQLASLKSQSDYADFCLYHDEDGYELQTGKWYTLDEDLAKMSLAFPGVLFLADCNDDEGEGDRWRYWAAGGEHTRTEPFLAWPEPKP